MQIDRILFPIESLGPGRRVVIWTVGCSKRCHNCSNPELWKSDEKKNVPVKDVIAFVTDVIKNRDVDGISITGGDPLEQKNDFLFLIKELHKLCNDILVYTGYTWESLKETYTSTEIEQIKKSVGVLIDGPYIDNLNTEDCCLRGSSNQRIIFFDQLLQKRYDEYILKGRQIQNVYLNDRVLSVGIHSKEKQNG